MNANTSANTNTESVPHRSGEDHAPSKRNRKTTSQTSAAYRVLCIARALFTRGAVEIGRKKHNLPPLVRDLRLRIRKSTLLVYLCILSHAGRDGQTRVTCGTIAGACGFGLGRGERAAKPDRGENGERTVRRELARLFRYGMIDVRQETIFWNGKPRAWRNVYTILDVRRALFVADPEPVETPSRRRKPVEASPPPASDVSSSPDADVSRSAAADVSSGDGVDVSPVDERDVSPLEASPVGGVDTSSGLDERVATRGAELVATDRATEPFSVVSSCQAGSTGAAAPAALLSQDQVVTLSPTLSTDDSNAACAPRTANHEQLWLAAERAPSAPVASAAPTKANPTPSPAPRAGCAATPPPRAAIRSERPSTAPPARQPQNESQQGGKEQGAGRAGKIARVIAYFVSRLCPDSLIDSSKQWEKLIARRYGELERSTRWREHFPDEVAVLCAAIDGVPFGRVRPEDIDHPINYVFKTPDRVRELARLGRERRAPSRGAPPSSSPSRGAPAETRAPKLTVDEWRALDEKAAATNPILAHILGIGGDAE